jgi:peptidoglycan/xylan/chitin deacetylase (PgdA/CDA1 family)
MKGKLYLFGIVAIFVVSIGISAYYFYSRDNVNIAKANDIHKQQVTTDSGIESKKNITESKANSKDLQPTKIGQDQDLGNSDTGETKKLDSTEVQGNAKTQDRPLYSKEVFLTFDDGPSTNTLKILKILDENNVKATFFVVGENVDKHPDLVKAEYSDGMSIMNHSYSHEYSNYKSIEAFMADFDKCNTAIKNAIGVEQQRFLRFPGGSDNQVSNHQVMASIRNAVVAKGIGYVDWNTSSGDAASVTVPTKDIEIKLLNQLSTSNFSVILMHDVSSKTTTVEALQTVINYLKKEGFVFRTFNNLTPTEEKEMIKRGIINRGANKQ